MRHFFYYISACKILLTKNKKMAYAHKNSKGTTYYLHNMEVELKSTGKKQTIYFFAKSVLTVSKNGKAVQALNDLPAGRKVKENTRTGLPFVSKA